MGKIAPVSAKYIIHTQIQADGVVEKPDVIGAVFGQTEGLLGAELELRELQKSGRIGRIEVKIDTNQGKSTGEITIPSSLDMAETAIVASSLETIQRVGPCNAKLTVKLVEDVRVTKREYVVDRAKELLKGMIDKGPDSTELMEEIKAAVRSLEMVEYGPEKIPAGPGIKESDELIVVEGRADVINMLKNGFRNVICINGTSVPPSVAELTKTKTTTVFVDGDRGGILIVKELLQSAELDFVARAPAGKEVEELTKKEIHKELRARIPVEQFKEEMGENGKGEHHARPERIEHRERPEFRERPERQERSERYQERPMVRPVQQQRPPMRIHPELGKQFRKMLEELVGTRGAYLLDSNMNILGKVPTSELKVTLGSISDVDSVIMDGQANQEIISAAEMAGVNNLVASEIVGQSRQTKLFTAKNLGL